MADSHPESCTTKENTCQSHLFALNILTFTNILYTNILDQPTAGHCIKQLFELYYKQFLKNITLWKQFLFLLWKYNIIYEGWFLGNRQKQYVLSPCDLSFCRHEVLESKSFLGLIIGSRNMTMHLVYYYIRMLQILSYRTKIITEQSLTGIKDWFTLTS